MPRPRIIIGLLASVLLTSVAAPVFAIEPEAITPSGTTAVVSGGEGTQTDPHVSGALVSYTSIVSSSSEIRYQDLALGASSDASIPKAVGEQDSLSDVSGDIIVFRRIDGTTTRRIMLYDRATGNPPVELAPAAGTRRGFAAIGGETVAFQQFDPTTNSIADICLASVADTSAAATCVTGDGALNREAAVSADGNTVAFSKCNETGTQCDVYAVTRPDAKSGWGSALQLTTPETNQVRPDTNGRIVAYATDEAGDWDIKYVDVDGTNEQTLVMPDGLPGDEHNPNMSADLVAFERTMAGEIHADLYAYDVAEGTFYRLTDTPDVDETLNDISVSPDRTVRVVWAANQGADSGTDVYAFTFALASGPKYEVCPLFDQSRAFRLGSTAPIKLRLCDADGTNLSTPDLELTVGDLVKLDGSSTTALAEDSGNANPDSAFRYDAELEGYVFNLSTKGLAQGTWELGFAVADDGPGYRITFDLR